MFVLPDWAEGFAGVETERDLRVLEAELAAPNGNPSGPAADPVPSWAAAAGCATLAEADALAEEIAESAGTRSPAAPPPAVAPPIIEAHAPPPPASRIRDVDELRLRVLARKARRAATGDAAPLTEAEADTLVRIAYEVTGS